jgi:hypothetical protein
MFGNFIQAVTNVLNELADSDLFGVFSRRLEQVSAAQEQPRVYVKVTRNTKGYNWEATVSCNDPTEALTLLKSLEAELRQEYGEQPEVEPAK